MKEKEQYKESRKQWVGFWENQQDRQTLMQTNQRAEIIYKLTKSEMKRET